MSNRMVSVSIVSVAALVGSSAVAAPLTELRVCMDSKSGFPVYAAPEKADTPFPGYYIDFMKKVGEEMKLKVEIVRRPFMRCLLDLEQGNVHTVVSASYKEDRTKSGAYPMKDGKPDASLRISDSTYNLFVLPESTLTWDGKALSDPKAKVGTIRGYSVIDDLKALNIPFEEVQTDDANFGKLKAKRIAAIAYHGTMKYALAKLHGLKMLEPPLKASPYFVMVSHQLIREQPALVESLWKTTAKVRDSAGMKARYEEYLKMDPEKF